MKKRKQLFRRSRLFPMVLVSLLGCVLLFFYYINAQLMPTFMRYAEVETNKIASYVISKAITSRTSNVLDSNEVIESVGEGENQGLVDSKLNTEVITRIMAETQTLVQSHLEEAEKGNLDHLPKYEDIEYDEESMQRDGGIVFYVPIGLATGLPLLGNLGPKIPIRFHVIGNVQVNMEQEIQEFGINNAAVKYSVRTTVNVQIIVPFDSMSATVEQKIPVAITLLKGNVPYIYSSDASSTQPAIEVPLPATPPNSSTNAPSPTAPPASDNN
ncbi:MULTISPECIES: sporulation protein YunB [unclassified Rummeliibacillus]|uniref:sporulation protein YunB n=1 Tax=unclassified Rummeliibacillus TaxID=2622809 RepID=UPI000E66F552|nr:MULTISPECIES: sporulation protein YunB [unclassified Rummeliibacillus]RIJ63961.1 sporulation protein YunB [Rummeliibacillus sp. POC4]RPJ95496.1 sporulation protein YunB [Rummeliibacillus sp. TYF005]